MINLKDKQLYRNTDRNTAVYFNSFGIEPITQEVLNEIEDKYVKS